MAAPRVGIIGARRVRQGLGPFVARHLREAGAEVPCFLATTRESQVEAQRVLRESAGIVAEGYVDLATMFAHHELDALAILSPAETHHTYLEAALEAGLHVLCEKPLVWGELDTVATTYGLIAEFERRGLILWENCQWPYTLSTFEALYPDLPRPCRQFDMHMSPTGIGPQMLADSMPHPLSMLQALVPEQESRISGAMFTWPAADAQEARISFDFHAGPHVVGVQVVLTATPEPPRPAAYAVDGQWVRRLLRMEDYAMSFTDGLRVVDLPDPAACLIAEFVGLLRSDGDAKVYATVARQRRRIGQRVEMLHYLRNALEAQIA